MCKRKKFRELDYIPADPLEEVNDEILDDIVPADIPEGVHLEGQESLFGFVEGMSFREWLKQEQRRHVS